MSYASLPPRGRTYVVRNAYVVPSLWPLGEGAAPPTNSPAQLALFWFQGGRMTIDDEPMLQGKLVDLRAANPSLDNWSTGTHVNIPASWGHPAWELKSMDRAGAQKITGNGLSGAERALAKSTGVGAFFPSVGPVGPRRPQAYTPSPPLVAHAPPGSGPLPQGPGPKTKQISPTSYSIVSVPASAKFLVQGDYHGLHVYRETAPAGPFADPGPRAALVVSPFNISGSKQLGPDPTGMVQAQTKATVGIGPGDTLALLYMYGMVLFSKNGEAWAGAQKLEVYAAAKSLGVGAALSLVRAPIAYKGKAKIFSSIVAKPPPHVAPADANMILSLVKEVCIWDTWGDFAIAAFSIPIVQASQMPGADNGCGCPEGSHVVQGSAWALNPWKMSAVGGVPATHRWLLVPAGTTGATLQQKTCLRMILTNNPWKYGSGWVVLSDRNPGLGIGGGDDMNGAQRALAKAAGVGFPHGHHHGGHHGHHGGRHRGGRHGGGFWSDDVVIVEESPCPDGFAYSPLLNECIYVGGLAGDEEKNMNGLSGAERALRKAGVAVSTLGEVGAPLSPSFYNLRTMGQSRPHPCPPGYYHSPHGHCVPNGQTAGDALAATPGTVPANPDGTCPAPPSCAKTSWLWAVIGAGVGWGATILGQDYMGKKRRR
jgi:hypothetical protein